MAATLIYLKLEFDNKPVLGESTTVDYEDQIQVASFQWGVSNRPGDNRSLRPDLRPNRVTLQKFFDRASINLCSHMQARRKFSKAEISFASHEMAGRVPGVKPKPMLVVTLADGFVEQVRMATADTGRSIAVREDVALSFRRFELAYHQADPRTGLRSVASTFATEQPSIG